MTCEELQMLIRNVEANIRHCKRNRRKRNNYGCYYNEEALLLLQNELESYRQQLTALN